MGAWAWSDSSPAATATSTSLRVTGPTPQCTIFISTLSLGSEARSSWMAAIEPCESTLITAGTDTTVLSSSPRSAAALAAFALASAMAAPPALAAPALGAGAWRVVSSVSFIIFQVWWSERSLASSLARCSVRTTLSRSPALGRPLSPTTRAACEGPTPSFGSTMRAAVSGDCVKRRRTLPNCVPTTTKSPTWSRPQLTSTSATAPSPFSWEASSTMASAGAAWSALRSNISASIAIRSLSSSSPSPVIPETCTTPTSPP
mmetsp:Transcript_82082/g.232419  ORF Transcript_82082/g.232419 Transcript_82082/m.232419 type:complete len:260 (-) Transcript_82082:299-1078(-)